MANITAMPFRSVDGDRPVSATMDARRFGQYVKNGLVMNDNADSLKVSVVDGELALSVAPGAAVVNGYSMWADEETILNLSLPDTTYSRIDRVVLRLNLNLDVRFFEIKVLEGIPSASPVAPEYERSEFIHDLVLADVRITANSLTIDSGAVTDMRKDKELCGVSGAILSPDISVSTTTTSEGTPTPTLVGKSGDVYIDTSVTPNNCYMCLGMDRGYYIWAKISFDKKISGKVEAATEIITASTTWVVPSDLLRDSAVRILVFGGGGGGGSFATPGGGGGGHMGEYVGFLTDDNYDVTIGKGGSVGASGGVTSFGNLVSASGGSPGNSTDGDGGDGGTGGGGNVRGRYDSANTLLGGGNGGNGTYGGGGGGGGSLSTTGIGGNGGNGGTYGGGGGAGCNNTSGGGYGGNGGTYGGNGGGTGAKNGTNGAIGTDTTALSLDFSGKGNGGSYASNNNAPGASGGGGGYGGNGGNGGNSNSGGGGGGGGYGGNGGNGGICGGGGGGYGGNGGAYGGGGGYGSSNYGSGGNGGTATAGKAGVCIIQYKKYVIIVEE